MNDTTIATELLSRLTQLKDVLSHSGSVLLRCERGRKLAYRLRVRAFIPELGFRRMLAIGIPDDGVADVRELLGSWRAEYHRTAKAQSQRVTADRQARISDDRERRAMKKLVQEIAGGTKYNRKKVGKAWDNIYREGVIASTLWLLSRQYLRPHELSPPYGTGRQKQQGRREWDMGIGVDVGSVVRQRASERREWFAKGSAIESGRVQFESVELTTT
jgi:hypothetical protein